MLLPALTASLRRFGEAFGNVPTVLAAVLLAEGLDMRNQNHACMMAIEKQCRIRYCKASHICKDLSPFFFNYFS